MLSLAALVVFSGFFGQGTDSIDFDKFGTGKMPPSWSVVATHPGTAPQWEVIPEKSAPSRKNVFAQVSPAGRDSDSHLALYDKMLCREGDLSVKFRIESGRQNKAAGIVWRYQDSGNYYLLQFSAEHRNIALFHVENGQARAIPVMAGKTQMTAVPHDIREDQWYVVKVNYRGSKVRVSFGNRLLFEAVDTAIQRSGKTGLWTRAGTIALFDDFRLDKKS